MKSPLVALCVSSLICAATGQGFDMKCHPFQAIEQHNSFDGSCKAQGSSKKAQSGGARQNVAKNNFCASGTVQDISFEELVNLQKQARGMVGYKGWSGLHPPATRVPFHQTTPYI